MYMLFDVNRVGNNLKVIKKTSDQLYNVSFYIDHYYLGNLSYLEGLTLKLPYYKARNLYIKADVLSNGYFYSMSEQHDILQIKNLREQDLLDVDYMAGDILVACDNVSGLPFGYMGHAAIVVDSKHIVEALPSRPIVRKTPISSFTENHPNHAVIRPRSSELGEKASEYALDYLEQFQNGEKTPEFNFTLKESLTEGEFIYCSKFVWMSYFHGAGYEIPNDHLWFAPEDLYTKTKENDNFEVVAIHPEFEFKVDL
ncbi:C40 family peptidase [Litchfieldia alkalitelluris]|uniref:YiiX/YebB-like N1pC/P60 family cysteine hydrolase n=1 Tax=Litchfieldia alkalitelluris TaxID=304268 RepID=UPI000997CA4E|nr:YiiX/YebB-like N1pC/P60 family cysteine hydrolase [Litchfieldia alkalitelluris]